MNGVEGSTLNFIIMDWRVMGFLYSFPVRD